MKPQARVRPYIPMAVRVAVAERQVVDRYGAGMLLSIAAIRAKLGKRENLMNRLVSLLAALGLTNPQLDHDPALILRPYNARIKNPAARYTPNANDPAFLIYREDDQHLQKTTGRRAGAERTVTTKGSDIGLKAKFARLEGRTKKRPKKRIPGRSFPKGRAFPKKTRS